MDPLLTVARRRLPAIPGGTSGDARFGLWLLACGEGQSAKARRTPLASGEPNSSNIRKAS